MKNSKSLEYIVQNSKMYPLHDLLLYEYVLVKFSFTQHNNMSHVRNLSGPCVNMPKLGTYIHCGSKFYLIFIVITISFIFSRLMYALCVSLMNVRQAENVILTCRLKKKLFVKCAYGIQNFIRSSTKMYPNLVYMMGVWVSFSWYIKCVQCFSPHGIWWHVKFTFVVWKVN